MSNQPQDLSILLNQLEILQEENKFLQTLVDAQNLTIQKIEKNLEETKEELKFTNYELTQVLSEEFSLIKVNEFRSELTQEDLIQLLILLNLSPLKLKELVWILNLIFQKKVLSRSSKKEIKTNRTQLRKPLHNMLIESINLRFEAMNLRHESKQLKDNLKNTKKKCQNLQDNFNQFKAQYQKIEQQFNKLSNN